MSKYVPYHYNGKTMLIERHLNIGSVFCEPVEYDLLDTAIHPFAVEQIAHIKENGYDSYLFFDDQNLDFFNNFHHYSDFKNEKIFLFNEIYCARRIKTIINIRAAKYGKLWLNGKILSIHPLNGNTSYYLTATLEKGKNIFLFEQYSPDKNSLLSLQIRDYKREISGRYSALSQLGSTIQIDPLILIHPQPFYNITDAALRFMYLSNDADKCETEYHVDIYDSRLGTVKSGIKAELNKPVEISLAYLRDLHEDTLRYEYIRCIFQNKSGNEIENGFCVILNDFEKRRLEIRNRAIRYTEEMPPEASTTFLGYINQQEQYLKQHDCFSAYWFTWGLSLHLTWLEMGIFPYEPYKKAGMREYKQAGMHDFFIHSNLDDKPVKMKAFIPDTYDKNYAYPVVIALLTGDGGTFSAGPMKDLMPEPCLCFDVTCRGFTGGGYIGEASILEILDWIKKNYTIDRDRIYLLGSSNGGYAAYAIAQTHPHLAAAIFPLASLPYIKTIKNISNIPTYQIVSAKDRVFTGHENEVKHAISRYGNYHQYDFEEMTHPHIMDYLYHKDVIHALFKAKRNLFPNQILYKTERNRHLESFWVKLHGIASGHTEAGIRAKIVDEHCINIVIDGSNGLTVTIPPQIDRSHFTVSVNKKSFTFKDYEHSEILFHRNQQWELAASEPEIDYRKGTGLLDVYLNSLRIIVPENPSEIQLQTAQHFSRPQTNGFNPIIYGEYPIYAGQAPNNIFEHNLIVLDSCGDNGYTGRFGDLPIAYDKDGYAYQGIRYEGSYVIMQIIANTFKKDRSILIINTNNEALLKQCLFTRKVIIPYYTNGLHPYWNNEALIFNGKTYYGIYEFGAEIKEIQ